MNCPICGVQRHPTAHHSLCRTCRWLIRSRVKAGWPESRIFDPPMAKGRPRSGSGRGQKPCECCGEPIRTNRYCQKCQVRAAARRRAGWPESAVYDKSVKRNPAARKIAIEPEVVIKTPRTKYAIPKWRTSTDKEIAKAAFRARGPATIGGVVHLRYDGYLTTWEPRVLPGLVFYELVGEVVRVEGLEALFGW